MKARWSYAICAGLTLVGAGAPLARAEWVHALEHFTTLYWIAVAYHYHLKSESRA